MCSSRRLKPRAISYPVQYRPFRYPIGAAFGSGKSGIQKQQLKKQNSSKSNDFEEFWCAVMDFFPPGLLVHRLSQGQIGAVSAPICAFCHRSLGGFSVVSAQPCPFFSDSGSKVGQAQSSRIPLTSKVELIYIERGSPGRKLFGLFSYIPKLR